MAIVIEDGTGILSANAYGDNVEFKAYHADRGNAFTGGGGDIDKACIRATDYIENRFGRRFKGVKQFAGLSTARSTLTMTAQPIDTETVVIGSITYRFMTTMALAFDVQIGANVDETLNNLIAAINLSGTEGTEYFAGMTENADAFAGAQSRDRILVAAKVTGTAGNGFATTTTATASSWNFAVLTGGSDENFPQPLSFPRLNLIDRDGQSVDGIPPNLKAAMFEYALRALTSALNPDPEFNDTGRVVKKESVKVGPIEESTEFEDSGQVVIRTYPAADALLADYIQPTGGVIR
jgi:hypothetical protein